MKKILHNTETGKRFSFTEGYPCHCHPRELVRGDFVEVPGTGFQQIREIYTYAENSPKYSGFYCLVLYPSLGQAGRRLPYDPGMTINHVPLDDLSELPDSFEGFGKPLSEIHWLTNQDIANLDRHWISGLGPTIEGLLHDLRMGKEVTAKDVVAGQLIMYLLKLDWNFEARPNLCLNEILIIPDR